MCRTGGSAHPRARGQSRPPSMPMKCPTGNAVDLSGGMLRMACVELTYLAAQRLVAVHDTLGIAGGPEVNAISAGFAGSVSTVPSMGSSASRSSKRGHSLARGPSVATSPTIGTSTHTSWWKCHPPELIGGDEHLRCGGRQDVADFLSTVEVHDRNDDRAEQTPIAQNVAAASIQFGSWNATTSPGPTPRAWSPAANRRATRSTSLNVPVYGRTVECTRNVECGLRRQRIGQQCAQRVGRPPALGFIAVLQLGADRHDWGSRRPCRAPQRCSGYKHRVHSRTCLSFEQV